MINHLLHSYEFWTATLIAPLTWYIFVKLCRWSYQQSLAIQNWYAGMPLRQWVGVYLIIWGSKIVRSSQYCKILRYDNRLWFSPMTKGFEIGSE